MNLRQFGCRLFKIELYELQKRKNNMEVKNFEDLNLYLKGFEIASIGNKAIKQVQEENKKKGIPLVYSVDGKIFYELADGTITTSSPFKE